MPVSKEVSVNPSLSDVITHNRLSGEGIVVWKGSNYYYILAERSRNIMTRVNIDTGERHVSDPIEPRDVSGILCGVAINVSYNTTSSEHVIVVTYKDASRRCLHIKLEENTWKILSDLQIDDPLVFCPVNYDGIAILTSTQATNHDSIHVYSCSDIRRGASKAKTRQNIAITKADHASLQLGPLDKMCYSKTKFYIYSYEASQVFQVNSRGNVDHVFGQSASRAGMKKPGCMYKPCGLFAHYIHNEDWNDSYTRIIVSCYDGIHLARIRENKPFDAEWSTDVLDLYMLSANASVPELKTNFFGNIKPYSLHEFNSQLVQTVWCTLDPDVVAVGSAESAHITLVRSDGKSLDTQFINRNARIMSGVNVFRNTHLVVLRDEEKSYIVCLEIASDKYINNEYDIEGSCGGNDMGHDDELNRSSHLDGTFLSHGTRDFHAESDTECLISEVGQTVRCMDENPIRYINKPETIQPMSLFMVDHDHYGMLSRHKHTEHQSAIIEIYTKQAHTHKETVQLDFIKPGVNDRACVDKNGLYIVTNYDKNRIYTFDIDGTKLDEIDSPSLGPYSVIVDVLNEITVLCMDGLYKSTKKTHLEASSVTVDWCKLINKPLWDVCCSATHLYTVYKQSLNFYQTDNLIYDSTESVVSKAVPENKNLPLLKFAEPGAILKDDQVQKYKYPVLHPTPSLQSLSYAGHVTLPETGSRCWTDYNTDRIIIAGGNPPTLTTVTPLQSYNKSANEDNAINDINVNFHITNHRLSVGSFVKSGVCVKENLHFVCVGHREYVVGKYDTSDNKVHLVYLDTTSSSQLPIHPIATLDVVNPVYVFSISKQLYGVVCMDGSDYTFINGRIRILGLDTLLLSQDTDHSTIQSTALWGRRTLLHMDLPLLSPADTVSVTPRGLYCVLSCHRCEARVYSRTGVYLYTLGERRGESDHPHPGRLYFPWSIHSTADNTLVITGYQGDVHIYDMYSNSGDMIRRRCVKDARYRQKLMLDYVDVNDDENNEEDKRWEYKYKHDPAGWRVIKGMREEGRVHRSVITQTLCCVIDWDNVRKLRVYNIQS